MDLTFVFAATYLFCESIELVHTYRSACTYIHTDHALHSPLLYRQYLSKKLNPVTFYQVRRRLIG